MKIKPGVGLISPNILDWTTIKHRVKDIKIGVYLWPVEATNSNYLSQKRLIEKVLVLLKFYKKKIKFKFCENSTEIVFPSNNSLKKPFPNQHDHFP